MPDEASVVTETKAPATATAEAAPIQADKGTKGAPAAPAAAANGKTKQSDTATPADKGSEKTQSVDVAGKTDNLPKGVKVQLHHLREKKREAEAKASNAEAVAAENSDLKKRIAALEQEAQARPTQGTQDDEVDLLADPKKYRERVRQDAENAARKAYQDERDNGLRQEKLYRESAEAESWIGTRSHLTDPNFANEVQAVIDNDAEIGAIAGISPKKAMELAYNEVCKAKGVAPDWSVSRRVNEASAAAAKAGNGLMPSASSPAGAGPKVWKAGEITKYLEAVSPGTPEHRQRLAEVKTARAEGRIQ